VAIQLRALDTTTSARSSTSWRNCLATPKLSRKVEQCSHFSLSTKPNWATFGTTALPARAKQALISGVEKTQSEGGKVNE
jgi:hypothetical protein